MSHYVYQLQSCVWEITLACCFSCRYCGSKAGSARENELTTEECLQVAKQLADLGCRRVALIGGEVFMRPDWSLIAGALSDRGVRVSIITNGWLFSDREISELRTAGVESVAVSIDGPEEVHDAFRQKGSFRRAMEAIDVLSRAGIPVSVISTLHSRNVGCLDEMFRILKEKDIYAWQLQACSPMGNAADSGIEKGASPGEGISAGECLSTEIDFKAVIRFVEKHLENPGFAIGIADNIGYYTGKEGYLRGNPRGRGMFLGCRAGLTNIGIDSVGNVRGCESMYDDAFIEGNLREKTLSEIWNDPEAFSYNRKFTPDRLTGKCAECEFAGWCAGGCRSYNYFSNGGRMFESRRCAR